MSDTIRERIIAALIPRLGEITPARAYHQALGSHVIRARVDVDPEECPCVVLLPRPEEVTRQYGADVHVMEVDIEAVAVFGADNPSEVAEQMLGDVVECVTARKWILGYASGGPAEIEAGDKLTGATPETAAVVDAVELNSGAWAGGDAAGTLTLRRLSGRFQLGEHLNQEGGQADIATASSKLSKVSPEAGACAGLADDIRYTRGGPEGYPRSEETTVGVKATFEITYRTVPGNPYAQPT